VSTKVIIVGHRVEFLTKWVNSRNLGFRTRPGTSRSLLQSQYCVTSGDCVIAFGNFTDPLRNCQFH